jgi:hypothetical protein
VPCYSSRLDSTDTLGDIRAETRLYTLYSCAEGFKSTPTTTRERNELHPNAEFFPGSRQVH